MLFFRKKINLGETRGLLYLNNKYRRNSKNKLIKRFFRISSIRLGGEKKILELIFKGITNTNIINLLKIGSQNKVKKTDKLLKHKGAVLKHKFIDENNTMNTGIIALTTKSKYKIMKEDNSIETKESINIDNTQKLSQEVILLNNKDIDEDKLNNSIISNEKINKKYIKKVGKEFNNFFNNNEQILSIHKNGINNQKVSKNKIDKTIKLDNEIIYKIKKID